MDDYQDEADLLYEQTLAYVFLSGISLGVVLGALLVGACWFLFP